MSRVKNVIFARDKQTRNAIIVDPINVHLFLVRPLGHWAKDYRKKPNKCNGFRNVIVGRYARTIVNNDFTWNYHVDTNLRLVYKVGRFDRSTNRNRDVLIKRKVNRISDRSCYFSFREILVGSGNEFPDLQLTEIILNRSIYM